MFGDLKIPIESNAKAIMMLDEAVVKEAGIEYVFVQTSDTTFEQRKVSTGTVVDGRIEIREGLKIGENVVSKGVFYLKSELKKEEIEGDEH
jgi:cobalt-zinc-cadmium efflux system membrane fusion protein